MQVGYRITTPDEIQLHPADLFQISVYHRAPINNLERVISCACACNKARKHYVVHPVNYFLLDEDDETFEELVQIAKWSGSALLLHDEVIWQTTPSGLKMKRLEDRQAQKFLARLEKLESICKVSFEDAVNVKDTPWFWETFASSVTIDIGHLESAGINSVDFLKSLKPEILDKVEYCHMHRKHEMRYGLADHWPLVPGCRELDALETLLEKKPDLKVILELNPDELAYSLQLLFELKARFTPEEQTLQEPAPFETSCQKTGWPKE